MKVLMFGWEFPPFKSGGLGTACYDLTKGLARNQTTITFVTPFTDDKTRAQYVKLIGTQRIKTRHIPSIITPYLDASSYEENYTQSKTDGKIYGKNLFNEVARYAACASKIACEENHDIIHVHDWMTYSAGMQARRISKKPLVAHIHATEFDRTGGNPDPRIAQLEYEGLKAADTIVANSNFTKTNVIKHYKINPEKIKVVHWGIDQENPAYEYNYRTKLTGDKIVLFLGRITVQKGPEYFVEAAKHVSSRIPNVKFVVAGSGDKLPEMIKQVADLGLTEKFIFTGFLNGDDVHKMFQAADLYVMPSVSEPFGLVALESLKNGTPIIISKTSGVSEVLSHALKVDFWDAKALANKIAGTLKYPELFQTLKENGINEVKNFNVDEPARKCIEIYRELTQKLKR